MTKTRTYMRFEDLKIGDFFRYIGSTRKYVKCSKLKAVDLYEGKTVEHWLDSMVIRLNVEIKEIEV